MKIHPLHSWDVTTAEAVTLQRELASRVDVSVPLDRYELIAGADVSYDRYSPVVFAAVVVLRVADFTVVETQGAVYKASFPYVPGFLSFREAPALLEAFARVESGPDVVMLDGQGLAHPRRLGLACHVGLWLDRPCLGCAKSRLIGQFQEPARPAGSTSSLIDRGEEIGKVVRTRTGIQPVYVSPGHKINLESAVRVVTQACRGYRIPEPTRQAHLHVNLLRRKGTC
jgi:deoxyribonuclease V